ncbi:acyl carrier protein phosphodiesterase [Marinoscillum furvescens]|uniref:Acyl carrier protein phosphodiesterase n=1 Tax=Marinoscillum furvescens DSM 4134 TaxID=1122208 RepID=A0A3D9KXL3_MARFU|nr:ACP phosphodiesterase [Marinoscillum furvescens]RED91753.1 acyl carrier protein phosphodiesterase [Marinoscillum furvescens DSM 4134]
MNYLAHLYLSGSDPDITIGNFIGDFVKGKAFERFDPKIQTGVLLHRTIDEYTDSHPVVMQSKERLRPNYRHYAPVIVDIFYDHFLAAKWNDFHHEPLLQFTERFFDLTSDYAHIIPDKARQMLAYMKRDNWLYHYQHLRGIQQVLNGMSRRTTFDSHMELALADLKEDYEAYEHEFMTFFPDLKLCAHRFLNENTSPDTL